MLTILFFIFIGVAFLLRLILTAHVPFYDWDESIYAQVAVEMAKHKTWITTFNGRLWLEKPPLPVFLYSLFVNFKPAEFWLRLVSLTVGLIFLVLLYFLSKKIVDSLLKSQLKDRSAVFRQLIYFLPVAISLSSPLLVDRLVTVNTDILLALGWIGFFLVAGNFFWEVVFLSVGVLSKSLIGFYPLFLAVFPLPKKVKSLLRLPLLIIIPSIWYLFAYLKFGQIFIQEHFLDHLLKRVSSPIELHFGGKMFYFVWLYQDLFLLLILFISAYFFIAFDLFNKLKRDRVKILWQPYLKNYLILLSPLPFLLFLTLAKTKINWYLIPLVPLFALSVPYLIFKIKQKKLQVLLIFFVMVYFLFKFVPQTFLSKSFTEIPEKTEMARCVEKLPGDQVDFLVDLDQRKIGNFLEASHLYIDSSFIYGGSSSFVYYSQKKVNYFYKVDQFLVRKPADILVIAKNDYQTIEAVKKYNFTITPCSTRNFFVMIKN